MLHVRYIGEQSSPQGLGGLDFCGPSCVVDAVYSSTRDVFEGVGDTFGDIRDFAVDQFDSVLYLPDAVLEQINRVKSETFRAWAAASRLSESISEELVSGFNAVYDGVVELAQESWEKLGEACALFREYKDYINIGVQVIQQDYANAAANLSEVALEELGLPPVVKGTDSSIVTAAEFVCGAVDGLNVVSALANGSPVPPPLAPANTMIVVNGVAVKPNARQLQVLRMGAKALVIADGEAKVYETNESVRQPTAKKSKAAPAIVVGAGAFAALLILGR